MSSIECINETVRHGPAGWIYRYPEEVQPLPFENVNLFYWQELLMSRWQWALPAAIIYMVTIFGLQRWMKNRPALDLKVSLFWWNVCLGLFSIVGFSRTAPGLLKTLGEPNGFYDSICTKNWLTTQIGFWTIPFILSKPVEFGDSVFSVLRKKPLSFIQCYHHMVSMVVCITLGPMVEPALICSMVVNFGVHSLMYPYFALKTIGYKVPKIFADVITTAEFSQMIIGLIVNITSMYYKKTGDNCARSDLSIQVFAFVYFSFFLLFGKLFYDSVIRNPKGKLGKSGNGGITVMGGCDDEKDSCLEERIAKRKLSNGYDFK